MGDTANGTWSSRDLGRHVREEQDAKYREGQWALIENTARFAFSAAEHGENVEWTLSELRKVFDGRNE